MPDDNSLDGYDDFEWGFDPMKLDRQARRKRKKKAHHIPKKSVADMLQEIADTRDIEGGFETTYQPARHEAVWLYDSLRTFYQQALITDVLSLVKGGKEANVYRCRAHDSVGQQYLAAKVYRPRMFRNLRNDKMYREGRQVLTESGRPVDGRDVRTLRAIGKKTAYGQQVAHTSWLMHEYHALKALHAVHADVPQPISAGENTVLMSYVGDETLPAPALHTVTLSKGEARFLFERALENIELMLKQGMIHGDLSEYNILYWEGEITLIDFPQVVEIGSNSNAGMILERDIVRVCQYFNRFGIGVSPDVIYQQLWEQYGQDPTVIYDSDED